MLGKRKKAVKDNFKKTILKKKLCKQLLFCKKTKYICKLIKDNQAKNSMKYFYAGIVLSALMGCESERKTLYDVKTLPTEWVRLTKTSEGLVVYNTCDAGNLLLTITHTGKKSEIFLHGQQEDQEFEILNAYQTKNDTIVVKTKWKGTRTAQDFKFIPAEKEKHLGRWITTYPSGMTSNNIFVTTEKQMHYPKIDQPCKECWGEECDDEVKNEL